LNLSNAETIASFTVGRLTAVTTASTGFWVVVAVGLSIVTFRVFLAFLKRCATSGFSSIRRWCGLSAICRTWKKHADDAALEDESSTLSAISRKEEKRPKFIHGQFIIINFIRPNDWQYGK
jgi:hypothetical protein